MKRIIFILSMLSIATISVCAYSASFYEGMQHSIIRFHIVADSNSCDAQKTKFAVRDYVLNAVSEIDIKNREEFLSVAEKSANEFLRNNSLPYNAKAQAGVFHFPQKVYNDITLPAGEYYGVRLILGEGKGENWWCVMYPPICVDANDNAMDMLKSAIGDTSFGVITKKPQLRFKLLDFLNK